MTSQNSSSMDVTTQVWRNYRLVSMVPDSGLVEDAIVITRGERIVYAGARTNAPSTPADAVVTDLEQRLVTPALIDCHTHIVHGGNRAFEFEMRLEGASYADVAAAGGGIVSTVRATRTLSVDALVAQLKAANCDLCDAAGDLSAPQPACVAACPHDAAFRLSGPQLLERVMGPHAADLAAGGLRDPMTA